MDNNDTNNLDAGQLETHIQRAYDTVSRIGIREENLRLEAFRYALQTISAAQAVVGNEPHITSTLSMTSQTPYAKIASALNVPLEVVEVLYDANDRDLALNLPSNALPKSSLAAMREIAIVISVGRKYALQGATTPFEIIRAACDDQAKLDKKNFAMAMGSMRPMLTTTGKGVSRELIAKKPADNLARDILLRYGQLI